MKYCQRCVFPDTKPNLKFHSDGVCDACHSAKKKDGVDWEARGRKLQQIFDRYRSKNGDNYDCIIPVSGGKDSHYQTHIVKNVYGLTPLVVCFEPTLPTVIGRKNLDNLNHLGVDLLHIKRDPVVYRKMVLEGLHRVGDNEWPNHVGIYTSPFIIAVKYRIPLIVWGENQTEYGEPPRGRLQQNFTRRWLEEFGGLLGYRVEDMRQILGLTKQQMLPYIFPSEKELKEVGVIGIFLGYYLKWDIRKQIEIIKKLGFRTKSVPVEGTYTGFQSLDCDSMTIHDYLKFVKYGFGKATDHACLDVRLKRISRKKAASLVEEYDGQFPQKTIRRFLDYAEMSRQEFFAAVDPFVNQQMFEFDTRGRPIRTSDGNLILKPEIIKLRRNP